MGFCDDCCLNVGQDMEVKDFFGLQPIAKQANPPDSTWAQAIKSPKVIYQERIFPAIGTDEFFIPPEF